MQTVRKGPTNQAELPIRRVVQGPACMSTSTGVADSDSLAFSAAVSRCFAA